MKVIKAAVQHLNPLQTPVITLDQSLYALAKQIQWTLLEFDEHKFLAMMGGLHIEMASLQMLGKWLTGCGWSEIMYSAGVATQGIAESFLTASHVTRTWRAHQVIAASLHILQKKKAYSAYKDKLEETEQSLTFEDWKNTMEKKSPHFLFWGLVLHLEFTCLHLVRTFREANFALYVDAIRQILPWLFAMDHTNYARWLAVHYRDMQVLSKYPNVYKHFSDGAFVVHKTNRAFSVALDHAHEQVNALVKGQGGVVVSMKILQP